MAVISLDLASVATCPSHRPVGRRPCADQMQRRQTLGTVVGTAQRLAVDGDDLTGDHRADRGHPGAETRLERFGRQQREDASEGIVPRDAVGQLKELPKPCLLRATELCDGHPAVDAGERRRNGDDHHVEQIVPAPQRIARVFHHAEVAHKGGLGFWRHHRRNSIRHKNRRIVAAT